MDFLIFIGHFLSGLIVFICSNFDPEFKDNDKIERLFICLMFGYIILVIYIMYLFYGMLFDISVYIINKIKNYVDSKRKKWRIKSL